MRTSLDESKGLDVADRSQAEGGAVQIWSTKPTANQVLRATYLGDGTYSLVFADSGLALTAEGAANGSRVSQRSYTGDASQRWVVTPSGGGTCTVRSAAGRAYLNVRGASGSNGAGVQVWGNGSVPENRFRFVEEQL